MNSATLTRHLRSSGRACMHVLYGLHNLRIFELVHLKVDISLSIDRFLMSVRQRYTQSFALKFTETAESASCLLSLFYKSTFCNVSLLSVWPKIMEYFKSKWVHQFLHKSHLNHFPPPPHYIAIVYYFFNHYNTTSKYIFVQNYLKIKSQYNSSVF